MSNTILLKKSSTANAVPLAANLSLGEVALNYTDGNLFYKDGGGVVNLLVSNKFVSVTGNITGGNINAAGLSLSSNVVSALNVTSSIAGGNVTTPGLISAVGNITGGNLITANLVQGTTLSAVGNIIGGNINAAGLSLSGNVLSQINSTGNITTTGNISGNYILGNIANATGFSASRIINGTSEANIGVTDGNANISISGVSNVVVVTTTGLNVTGTVSANGNITGGNLITSAAVSAASVSASGNIAGGNLNVVANVNAGFLSSSGTVVATGNITGGNLITSAAVSAASVSASGNITGGNVLGGANVNATLFTGTTVSVTGNITGGNVLGGANVNATTFTGSTVSVTGNITGGNVLGGANVNSTLFTGTTVSVSGNITGGNVLGGANVNATTFTGSTVSVTGTITGGNLAVGSGTISTSGNITGGNVLGGANVNSTLFTGTTVSVTGNITGGNINTNTLVGTATTVKSTGDLNLSATGNVVLNSKYINGVLTPVQDADAANKGYVDSIAQGLDPKASVAYATASALSAYTYNNGTSGVGATITANAVGALSIDGSTPTVQDRVLIKNETSTDQPYNGIYVVTTVGSVSVSFVLTRSTDFDAPAEIPSAFTFVETGSTNADTGWVCTTNAPVTVGTTNIVFAQFSGAGSYTANTSAGLLLTGTVFSAKVDNTTTAFDGGGNIIVKASANLTTPNIGAATGTSLSVTGNVTGGNLNAAGLSLSSNVVSALNVTGAIAGANVTTPGLISAVGNITGGNLITANLVQGTTLSAVGNIIGGNLNAAGLSLSGNVTSALNVTGNITGGNVNGVVAVYSAGVQVLTVNDTVDGGTY